MGEGVGFPIWGFPQRGGGVSIFFGEAPDCVADPFGNVPCRRFEKAEKEEKGQTGTSPKYQENSPRKEVPKEAEKEKSGRTSPALPPLKPCIVNSAFFCGGKNRPIHNGS